MPVFCVVYLITYPFQNNGFWTLLNIHNRKIRDKNYLLDFCIIIFTLEHKILIALFYGTCGFNSLGLENRCIVEI